METGSRLSPRQRTSVSRHRRAVLHHCPLCLGRSAAPGLRHHSTACEWRGIVWRQGEEQWLSKAAAPRNQPILQRAQERNALIVTDGSFRGNFLMPHQRRSALRGTSTRRSAWGREKVSNLCLRNYRHLRPANTNARDVEGFTKSKQRRATSDCNGKVSYEWDRRSSFLSTYCSWRQEQQE